MDTPIIPGTAHRFDCPACRALDAADGSEDGRLFNPPQTHVKHENALVRSVQRTQDRAADRVTAFAGSLSFVYIHTIWFGVWIALNVGLITAGVTFDKFPFGLLTMIVSLEAIFLATFVMVSQNRQSRRSDLRSQLDYENNLRGEIWAIHIGAKLGIDPQHVEEVVRLALAASATEAS